MINNHMHPGNQQASEEEVKRESLEAWRTPGAQR